MNLYLIKQSVFHGYSDYFDSAVVAAETEDEARATRPGSEYYIDSWPHNPAQVQVELLGVAKAFTKAGVICASFNAG